MIHEFVTGGGLVGEPLPESWAAEGAAMRRALAAEFACVAGVVVTIDPRLPKDEGEWASVAIESFDQLETLAVRADFTLLIAPESSGTLEALTRRLDRAGARLLGSTADAVAQTADKAALGERLFARGIPTPRFRILAPGASIPGAADYPGVVKPLDGAGSLETFRVDGPDQLTAAWSTAAPRLLQDFIPGVPMSATFLVRRDGRVRLLSTGEQHMELIDRRFHYRGGALPRPRPEAEPILTRAVQAAPGLYGLVGVDFIWTPENHQAVVLEINPRPTTSCVGLLRLSQRGELARVWLDDTSRPEAWNAAVDRIVQRIANEGPVAFDAMGRTWRSE